MESLEGRSRRHRGSRAILIAALLLAGGLLTGVSIWIAEDYRRAISTVESHAGVVSRALEEHVHRVLQELRDSVVQAAAVKTITRDVLSSRLRKHENMRGMIHVGADGDLLAAYPDRKPFLKNYAMFEDFQHAKASAGPVIFAPMRGEDGRWFFGVGQADKNGGVVLAIVWSEYFSQFYHSLGLAQESSIVLLRSDGQYLYRHPFVEGTMLNARQGNIRLMQQTPEKYSGSFHALSPLDQVTRVGYVRKSLKVPLVTFVGIPKHQALQVWRLASVFKILGVMIFIATSLSFLSTLNHREAVQWIEADRIDDIQRALSAATGQKFFERLVGKFSHSLDIPLVMVGEIAKVEQSRTLRIQAIAFASDGRMIQNGCPLVEGTPSWELLKRQAVHVPMSVRATYPKDPWLEMLGAESYAGFPLIVGGEVAGVLIFLDRKPMHELPLSQAALEVFVARAGAELERIQTEKTRFQAETLKLRLEKRAAQAQKMEALGTLAGGIAHDFNNLLSIIQGSVEAAQIGQEGLNDVNLARIDKACVRGEEMVRKILTFSRNQPTVRSRLCIRELVQEFSGLLLPSLSPGQELSVGFDGDGELNVLGSSSDLQQVLLNLSRNGFQAAREGAAKVEVDVSRYKVVSAAQMKSPDAKPGHFIRIAICDNGRGISADILPRIFEPFFTTKPQGEGTGLGLAMAHGTVKSHGGFIEVFSEVGKGTRFEIYIPDYDLAAREESRALG